MWKKVELLKMSNFTFFHNVFYAICILKSFDSHISVVVCCFFEFGMVSKWCIREWVNMSSANAFNLVNAKILSFGIGFIFKKKEGKKCVKLQFTSILSSSQNVVESILSFANRAFNKSKFYSFKYQSLAFTCICIHNVIVPLYGSKITGSFCLDRLVHVFNL